MHENNILKIQDETIKIITEVQKLLENSENLKEKHFQTLDNERKKLENLFPLGMQEERVSIAKEKEGESAATVGSQVSKTNSERARAMRPRVRPGWCAHN